MREQGKIVAGQPIHKQTRDYRRIAQHPAHIKKHQPTGRRLLKLSFIILILCVFIWSWQKITNPQTWPIRTVQITGSYEKVDHNELRQLILPYVDRGFCWADTAALQDRLQQFPWIYSASVKRAWPDKLIINLVEQKPFARMGTTSLVNEQGELFQVAQSTMPANLPLFISPLSGQQKLILDNYKIMAASLTPIAMKIVAIALDARQAWSVQLDNGMVVMIGKVDPIQRLQRFVQTYPKIIGANAGNISTIDLRYASGITVRFKTQSKASVN